MNKRVIKYIQDNRLMLLIGITIAIGLCTVALINSFIFRSRIESGYYEKGSDSRVVNK